jgi:putative PIN family toxin of toxin-antitoxin system
MRGERSVPKVVVDPNVLVSSLITPKGTSAEVLDELAGGGYELVTSPALLAEIRGVLRRPRFRAYLTLAEVDAYVELLRSESIVVDDPPPEAEPATKDPRDEYLVALARAERVDALVSGDPHLTALRGVLPVLTPAEFLKRLGR